MKNIKKVLGTMLALVLVLSMLSIPALAAAPEYGHLEVGAATISSPLKAGDEVRIPVSLAGLDTGEYLSGFHCNIAAINDYVTVTGVEFADSIKGWSGGFNKTAMTVDKVNLAFAEHPENSLHENGKLFDVVCTVAREVPAGVSTGISLSGISMSQTSEIFLNSTDGTQAGQNKNSVVYPVDENGNPTGGIAVPAADEFTVTVAASKSSVEADETFDVTVTVNGGVFTGAEYDLTYEPGKFQLVSKPDDAHVNGGTIGHTYLAYNAPDATVIGTYTFKALAQDTEVTGSFTLTDASVETALSSIEGNSQPCNVSAPAAVTITLKNDLTVSAENVVKEYDGKSYGVTAAANKDGAVIKYMDQDGGYTLDASPVYSAAGEYTVRFRATLKGYEPAYGSATVTINAPRYVVETSEYVAGHSLVLVYTNDSTVTYSYDGNTMLDVSAAGYSKDGTAYTRVYAWVAEGSGDAGKIAYAAGGTALKVGYSCDVNASGTIDLRDVAAAVCVYNADENYMTPSQMALILRADVDHNKTVTMNDVSLILSSSNYTR
jgi:hypothetical protein